MSEGKSETTDLSHPCYRERIALLLFGAAFGGGLAIDFTSDALIGSALIILGGVVLWTTPFRHPAKEDQHAR